MTTTVYFSTKLRQRLLYISQTISGKETLTLLLRQLMNTREDKMKKRRQAIRFLMQVFGKDYWKKNLKHRLLLVREIEKWDVIPKRAVGY